MGDVRAVVFDVGNVLYDWHPRYLYEKLIDDPAELERVVDIVMSDTWHWQMDKGWKFTELEPGLIEQYPEDADYIRAWGSRFHESIGPTMPGMMELVEELDAKGVPIFGITNFPHEFWLPFRAQEAAVFDRFGDIVVSGTEGIAKPDPAIYQLALKRFGLAEGESIFVDDLEKNVIAAEQNGFVGHHFRDSGKLRNELRRLQLL